MEARHLIIVTIIMLGIMYIVNKTFNNDNTKRNNPRNNNNIHNNN